MLIYAFICVNQMFNHMLTYVNICFIMLYVFATYVNICEHMLTYVQRTCFFMIFYVNIWFSEHMFQKHTRKAQNHKKTYETYVW